MSNNDDINSTVDVPFDTVVSEQQYQIDEHNLSQNEILTMEKKAQIEAQKSSSERMFWLRKNAIILIVICLSVYVFFVLVDTVVQGVLGWKLSDYAGSFFELLKFLVPALVGFAFSENMSKKDI